MIQRDAQKLDMGGRPLGLSPQCALALSALLTFALGGCSFSIPLGSFMNSDETSSIKPKHAVLDAELDPSDWRIAEAALEKALRAKDGQDQEAVGWSNPATGRSGAFQPVAASFANEGKFCRAFVARIALGETTRMLQAVGCPQDGGGVTLASVEDWKGL